MSTIYTLAEQIRDTGSQIAMLEAELAKHPDKIGLGLLVNLRSLEKRLQILKDEFSEQTKGIRMDL